MSAKIGYVGQSSRQLAKRKNSKSPWKNINHLTKPSHSVDLSQIAQIKQGGPGRE
jgi:hypothetical protein